MSRTIFLIAGPSGSGKTTLTNALLERYPTLTRGVTVTTRLPRSAEIDGKDYHFVSAERFAEMARMEAFLETDTAYGENYGVPRSLLSMTGNLILIVTLPGAATLKRKLPAAKTILILPESSEKAAQRIHSRQAPNAVERVSSVPCEIAAALTYGDTVGFDSIIRNADFSAAFQELQDVYLQRGQRSPCNSQAARTLQYTYLSSLLS